MSRRIVATVVSLALLAACGGGGKKATPRSSSPPTTIATTTTAPPPVNPLTGELNTDPSKLNRPALVVKIDNADGGPSNSARPQLGINEADIVYEEMVEGSVTRLAAIFHSADSDPVGPVRSARTTDVSVFSPLNTPLFAWSGANVDFAQIIRNSPLIDVGVSAASGSYFRRNETGHVAPHNLYTSTSELFALAPPDAKPPSPLFQYRKPGEALPATARPVGSVHLQFGSGGGSAPVDWTWVPSGTWTRTQKGSLDVDEKGQVVSPPNVVILFVNYRDTGYVDVSGAPVPEAELVGSGAAWVLTGGTITEGTWTKPAANAITTYTDAAGAPIKLTPGRTWVELVPIGGGSITG